MTKKDNNVELTADEVSVESVSTDNKTNEFDSSNDLLERSKDKFKTVIVVGFTPEGKLDIGSTVTNFPWIQYALDKAKFELHVLENNMENKKASEK